jgi:glycosyltransferase involved in cell wall biosynthesis
VKVSVIVPTYQEAKGIESFLRQFERQTLPRAEFELIVVDGGSRDGTQDIARALADRLILQTSEGIGGARNDGAAAARADVLATTDADCRVPPDWLERIVSDFVTPDVVAVCGPDGPIDGGFKARLLYFFVRGIIRIAAIAGLYGTGGTNSAFRKRAFLAVGGYRSMAHSDDIDLGVRIRSQGRIVFDPRLDVGLSVRRLEKDGYLRTFFLWLEGDLKVLAGRRVEPKEYARQEY